MLSKPWSAETAFFSVFALFLAMQFFISATAIHSVWFYAVLLPVALWYLWQHKEQGRILLASPCPRAMALFFAYIIVHAAVMAGEFDGASKVIRNTLATGAFVAITGIFFGTVSEVRRLWLFRGIGLVAGLCAAISIALYYVWPDGELRMRPIGRANAQVLAAFVYTIGAIFALAGLHQRPTRALIGGLCLAVTLCLACVFMTQSRMALVVLLLSIGAAGVFYSCHSRKQALWTGGLILAGAAMTALLFGEAIGTTVSEMITRGDSYRMQLWATTLDKINDSPWLGHGMLARIDYNMTATYHTDSPHNIYLTTALALGIPGAAILLVAIGTLGVHILRRLPLGNHMVFFTGLLIICSLTSGMIDHSRIVKGPSPLWIIFWLPLAMGMGELMRYRQSHGEST